MNPVKEINNWKKVQVFKYSCTLATIICWKSCVLLTNRQIVYFSFTFSLLPYFYFCFSNVVSISSSYLFPYQRDTRFYSHNVEAKSIDDLSFFRGFKYSSYFQQLFRCSFTSVLCPNIYFLIYLFFQENVSYDQGFLLGGGSRGQVYCVNGYSSCGQ